jgi:hypothetical protein
MGSSTERKSSSSLGTRRPRLFAQTIAPASQISDQERTQNATNFAHPSSLSRAPLPVAHLFRGLAFPRPANQHIHLGALSHLRSYS